MFTFDQIDDIHTRLGKRASLPEYLRALNNIGVQTYDSYISDGRSEYFGKNNFKLVSPPVHKILHVSDKSDREAMMQQLQLHSEGKTDYMQMCEGLAASGVEKWTFDTNKMTMTYYDKHRKELLVEALG
jgi:uncharacterized protein YbcV (DUF1398 family)